MQERVQNRSGFNMPAVVLCGLALVIFLYAMSLFLQGGFLASQAKVRDAKLNQPINQALQAALAEQQTILEEGPRWLDDAHTKACIPIEAAMARVIEKAGNTPAPHPEGGR